MWCTCQPVCVCLLLPDWGCFNLCACVCAASPGCVRYESSQGGFSGLEAPKIFGLRFEDESHHQNSSTVLSGDEYECVCVVWGTGTPVCICVFLLTQKEIGHKKILTWSDLLHSKISLSGEISQRCTAVISSIEIVLIVSLYRIEHSASDWFARLVSERERWFNRLNDIIKTAACL